MQGVGFRVASELAEEVLIARGLAVIVILIVEAWAGQRHVLGLGMPGLAASQLRAQRFDQSARAQNAWEGVIALGAVQLEAQLAREVNPDRHLLFFPRRGIGFSQALDDLAPDEVTEQVRFGGFRDVLQVIDVTVAQGVQYEGSIVLKRDQIHLFPLPARGRFGRWQPESFFQAIEVGQYALVQLDQSGTGLPQAAIVFGQMAEARDFAGRQSAEMGLGLVGPGKHGGSMQRSLVGGAVTGGLAAAGLQVVDGTFDELTQGEQNVDVTAVVVKLGREGLTKAAGTIG